MGGGGGGGLHSRETAEGWPLLTVETAVNGDSKSTNERCPSFVGSSDLSCRYKRVLFCLHCHNRPIAKKKFTSPYSISIYLSSSPSKLAGQEAVLGRLSLSMCLWCTGSLRDIGGERARETGFRGQHDRRCVVKEHQQGLGCKASKKSEESLKGDFYFFTCLFNTA